MRTRIFYFFYNQVEDQKLSRKPRTQFPMFCEQNISSTCETGRRKARVAIALTYKHLLINKLNILLVYVYVHEEISLLQTVDCGTVSTYQVSSVQLVTDKKLEAFNNA